MGVECSRQLTRVKLGHKLNHLIPFALVQAHIQIKALLHLVNGGCLQSPFLGESSQPFN